MQPTHKRLTRLSILNALLSVSVVLSYFWCCSAKPADEKQSVVYACRNIELGATISDDDLAETTIERSKIPQDHLSAKSEAVGRVSSGIFFRQLIVYKHQPMGPNEGARCLMGVQPYDEITQGALPSGDTGIIDLTGNWIVKPEYCEIHYAPKIQAFWVTDLRHNLAQDERDRLKVALGHYVYSDTWKLLDHGGNRINSNLPLYAEGVEWPRRNSQELIISANSKQGVCDESGHEIVSPIYRYIEELDGKYFVALRESAPPPEVSIRTLNAIELEARDRNWEILDLDGKLLTKLPKNVAWIISVVEKVRLLCVFYSHSRNPGGRFSYGIVDISAGLDVPPVLVRSARQSDFSPEAKYDSLDHSDSVSLPFKYDSLLCLPNDTISVTQGAKIKVLNRQLKPLFVLDKKTCINWWSDGVYSGLCNNGHFKYFDEQGKQIGPEFVSITDFHKGHAVVGVDRKHFGLIDKKGKWILPPRYETLELCGDDRLIAKASHP